MLYRALIMAISDNLRCEQAGVAEPLQECLPAVGVHVTPSAAAVKDALRTQAYSISAVAVRLLGALLEWFTTDVLTVCACLLPWEPTRTNSDRVRTQQDWSVHAHPVRTITLSLTKVCGTASPSR